MKPLLLDLFCGAGGSAVGYYRAGFDIIGVDKEPQPNYPFPYYKHDALDFLRVVLNCRASTDPWAKPWHLLTAAHASPPCQSSCTLIKGNQRATADNHIDLIPETRELLAELGLPTVIENVQGAKVRRDLTLCGEMFGLDVIRHRYFEIDGFNATAPKHVKHRGRVAGWRHGQYFDGPYKAVYGDGGGKGSIDEWRDAMGIDWMQTKHELAESIPPAYTEHIGAQLLTALEQAA